ncbi:MAG: hypothetical protein V8S24_08270, partial [Gordonibacter pamelaeae]
PPRDVYLFSSNTEEDGGDTTPHLVEQLQRIGRVPYLVVDEGGAVIDNPPLGVDRGRSPWWAWPRRACSTRA